MLPFPIKGGKLYLYNNNPLLIYHYPGTTGLKTGFTDAAGRCLVATAERDGVRLGVVVLHSDAPGTQARTAARPRLRGRLPPAARRRAADAARRLSASRRFEPRDRPPRGGATADAGRVPFPVARY